jgi:hypothetical protein
LFVRTRRSYPPVYPVPSISNFGFRIIIISSTHINTESNNTEIRATLDIDVYSVLCIISALLRSIKFLPPSDIFLSGNYICSIVDLRRVEIARGRGAVKKNLETLPNMTRSRMFQHAFLLFHLSAAPLTLGFICSRVLESCRLPTSRSTNLRSRPLTAASNGGFSDGIGFIADFIVSQREWYNFGNCLVLFPPENVPKSVVHFVGGFVAGSAATVTYGTMLSCLAANGHLIVVTPTPAVESNHGKVAADVSASFTECYNQNLRPILGPIGEDLPIFGLSHSLGGKLTVLLNSRKQDRRR